MRVRVNGRTEPVCIDLRRIKLLNERKFRPSRAEIWVHKEILSARGSRLTHAVDKHLQA
jgi:hypothetical protein